LCLLLAVAPPCGYFLEQSTFLISMIVLLQRFVLPEVAVTVDTVAVVVAAAVVPATAFLDLIGEKMHCQNGHVN